nr:uncharacterized protein LOC107973094 isoform X4 [Pan troglodytes]
MSERRAWGIVGQGFTSPSSFGAQQPPALSPPIRAAPWPPEGSQTLQTSLALGGRAGGRLLSQLPACPHDHPTLPANPPSCSCARPCLGLSSPSVPGGTVALTPWGSGSDDTELRYSSQYEEHLDPFSSFSKRERQRKYLSLSPWDKATLSMGRLVLSNKMARTIGFFYTLFLHCLVFLVLYKLAWSESMERDCATFCAKKNSMSTFRALLKPRSSVRVLLRGQVAPSKRETHSFIQKPPRARRGGSHL